MTPSFHRTFGPIPLRGAGPAHQFDRYYKDGEFDTCRKRLDELTFCVKLKAASKDQAKVRDTSRSKAGNKKFGWHVFATNMA